MVTKQTIKGRRRGGGVRFGEMERDGLLSHGAVFLLQDRLFHGSDKTRVKVCIKCGSLLSPRVSFPTSNKNTSAIATNRFREFKSVSTYYAKNAFSEHKVKIKILRRGKTILKNCHLFLKLLSIYVTSN